MRYLLEKELETYRNSDSYSERSQAAKVAYDTINGRKIVLYGAGAVGRTLLDVLRTMDIEVAFFADKRYEEVVEVRGVKVRPIEALSECQDEDALIIIAIDPRLFLEYKGEIEDNIVRYCPNALVIQDGRILAQLLKNQKCRADFIAGEQFDLVDCLICNGENAKCDVFNDYIRKIAPKSNIDKSDFAYECSKELGVITSNICTIRCRSCCEMVPYYKEKCFTDADTIISDCRKIADATKFTPCIVVVGGEPFLNPRLDYILEELLKIPDVGFIKVFTNGTVVPGESLLKVLKNPRIVLTWSNYENSVKGELWENTKKTRAALEQAGISYLYSISKTWLDISSFEYVEKTDEVLEKDFEDCFFATCYRVCNGIYYRCPHQYAAMRLNKSEYAQDGCLNIYEADSPYELSLKLREFSERKYVEACRYCVVLHKAKEMPAGEQLED